MSLSFTPIHRDDLCKVTADMGGTYQPVGSSYLIMPHNPEQSTAIKFHYGPPGTVKGISNESLIAILIHRITTLQSNAPCGENEVALKCLDEAMEALKQRSKRRLVHTTTPTGRDDHWLRKALEEPSPSSLEDIGRDYFNVWAPGMANARMQGETPVTYPVTPAAERETATYVAPDAIRFAEDLVVDNGFDAKFNVIEPPSKPDDKNPDFMLGL